MGVDEMQEFKLKPMKCEFNFLSKSDGSAILSQGETVVLVSVNGPLDVKMQNQSISKSTLEILFCTKGGKPSVEDRYKENVIKQTCEVVLLSSLYPRTAINITIQELEDYGGFLSCALNCVCLALLNAGVAMRCVYAAVSCAIDERGDIVLEPTRHQLDTARANLNFVFESQGKTIITSFTEGSFGEDTYREALERCRAASDLVFTFYRDMVKKYSGVLG